VADGIDLVGLDTAEAGGIESFADDVEEVAGSGEAQEGMKVLAAGELACVGTCGVVITVIAVFLRPATARLTVGMDVRAAFWHGRPPFWEMMCKGLKGKTVAEMIQNETQINAANSSGYAGDDERRSRGGWNCNKA
jgi:hypothetical protein